MSWTLEGKTCLLTGATQGIGRAAATMLARQGPKLVIVGRDPDKTARVVDEVRRESGNAKVEAMIADLSVVSQVRALARDFKAKHARLDVLVNNAGGIFDQRKLTADGFEYTFALDHLAYFVLTNELLDLLKASAPARVVSVSSRAHYRGRIAFDDLMLERGYGQWKAYSQAKLANVLFTRELAIKLAGTGVTANCLHPGVVQTGFGVNTEGWLRWAVGAFGRMFLSPEQGADTLVWLASSPEVENVSGKYFAKRKEETPSKIARDDEVARRLWDVSERLVAPKQAVAG
jgi:NAD(P)-dependent dehydrogenase (short-subunit alcohol dehydrogenase family)